METAPTLTSNSTVAPTDDTTTDNTTTFIIGFGILLIFVLLGILASVFLCITLKKDAYLWEADRERQLQQKQEINVNEVDKTRRNEKNLDNTQI